MSDEPTSDPADGARGDAQGAIDLAHRLLDAAREGDEGLLAYVDRGVPVDLNDADGNTLVFLRMPAAQVVPEPRIDDDGDAVPAAEPGGAPLLCITNLSGSPRQGLRVGVPSAGEWTVVLDTDATDFHGDGWREQTGQSRPSPSDHSLGCAYSPPMNSSCLPGCAHMYP